MIIIKNASEIDKMRRAGELTALAHKAVEQAVCPGVTTADLDKIATEVIRKNGGIPSFKGYNGFPANICASVNEEVIHGIPSKRVLREGDIIGVDIGVVLDGFHGDAAATYGVGKISVEAQRLIDVTKQAFYAGFAQAIPGNRISDISIAVQETAESAGFSVVREFVGHGVGHSLHEAPEVPNYHTGRRGVRLQEGMTLAVEPMINAGGYEILKLKDDWTIVTADGSLSAHYEHSIAITKGEPILLTVL